MPTSMTGSQINDKGSGTQRRFTVVIRLISLVFILLIIPFEVMAEPGQFAFETDSAQYVIGSDGSNLSLRSKETGKEWLSQDSITFASVIKGSKSYPISAIKRLEDLFRVSFGESGVQADYRITPHNSYIVIELVAVHGDNFDEIRFMQLRPVSFDNAGAIIAARWNNMFTVCLMALGPRVDSKLGPDGLISASVYPEYGTTGQKAALIAVPTSRFLTTVQNVERDCNLPSPKIGLDWAKASPDVRTNYLFIDLSESNVDEVIRYAKLGGFRYIMIYCSSWASSFGSYEINLKNFPRGEESLKAAVAKCHAAGLKVGLHMMTSLVSKVDPLVRPVPDSRLLKDAETKLAVDVGEGDHDIVAINEENAFFSGSSSHGSATTDGIDIQIDREIIRCGGIGKSNSKTFSGCTRGYAGTKPSSHKIGAKIHRLVDRYGCYMVDLRTSLKSDLADRIAGLINRCGFDMIYFDGGEANGANGAGWYWIGQQQMSVYERVKRDILIQGSGITHWTWHLFSRITCDDFAALATREYLDHHKIQDSWEDLTRSFMPAELGWWGLLNDAYDHPATLPDEIEHCGARMVALDSPISLETRVESLKANGRTEEMFKLLSKLDLLRLGRNVSQETRDKLRAGQWGVISEKSQLRFYPAHYETKDLVLPGDIEVHNPFGAQPIQFRLRALPSLRKIGDSANKTLFRPQKPLKLDFPEPNEHKSGWLAARVELTDLVVAQGRPNPGGKPVISPYVQAKKPLDLRHHRGLAIVLRIDGFVPRPHEPAPVLNIQLQSANNMYRDYYVDLNCDGEKIMVIPETNVERMLPEFRSVMYSFKRSMYSFDYSKVVGLNLRWMRLPKAGSFTCHLSSVEALAEEDIVLRKPEISMAKEKLVIPAELNPCDYVEVWRGNGIRHFDRNGVLLSTYATPHGLPFLEPGRNKIVLSASSPGRVKLTTMMMSEDGI
jgi:hypothetical protein